MGELPFTFNARFRSNFQYPRYLGPDYGKNSQSWRK